MTRITLNLQNSSQKDALMQILEKYTNDFEYTSDRIFRIVVPPVCSCGARIRDHIRKLLTSSIMEEFYSFSTPVRKRLERIKKNWKHPTAFYFVE